MNARHNVRAKLREYARIRGIDGGGKPFDIQGETVDFSRKGLGLIVDRDLFVPGMVLSLDLPGKLSSSAVVQWTRGSVSERSIRVGLQLVNPAASFRFRMAACFLLAFALISQLSIARPRRFSRAPNGEHCTVGLADMKSVIQRTLGKYGFLSEDEKTFLTIQHERMSPEEYTRWLAGFFKDERKRNAAFAWYRYTFQERTDTGRSPAAMPSEALSSGTQ
jgi:hypothetical protein